MMKGQDSNFVALEQKDFLSKARYSAKEKLNIRLWIKGQAPIHYRIKALETQDPNIDFTLFSEGSEDQNVGHELMFNLNCRDINYFGKAKLNYKSDADDELSLTLTGPIYRLEKRVTERLLVYPHYQAYGFFKFKLDEGPDYNVVYINKERKDEVFFDPPPEELWNQLVHGKYGFVPGNQEFIASFKLYDLANHGISLLVHQRAAHLFNKDREFEQVRIFFDGKIYDHIQGKSLYSVSFLNYGTNKSAYFKVGMKIKIHPDLKEQIKALIEKSNSFDDLTKTFEKLSEKNEEK